MATKEIRFDLIDVNAIIPQSNPVVENFIKKYENGQVIAFIIKEDTSPGSLSDIKADSANELGGIDGTTNFSVYVKSSNAGDDYGSTGCQIVKLLGIQYDSDVSRYRILEEYITMNGTANVNAANQYCEVIDLFPVSHGGNGNPDGTITLYKTTGDVALLAISAGQLFSSGNKVFIPQNYYGAILSYTGRTKSRTSTNNGVQIDARFNNFVVADRDILVESLFITAFIENIIVPFCGSIRKAISSSFIDFQDVLLRAGEVYDATIFVGISPLA